MNSSEHIEELASAFAAAQGELDDTPKTSKAFNYHYSDLATINRVVRPVLARHGLAVVQHVTGGITEATIETVLMHKSGQWISSGQMAITVEPKKGLSQAQCLGSSITYARRYQLSALLAISSHEDDDGASSAPSKHKEEPKPVTEATVQTVLTGIRAGLKDGDADLVRDVLKGLSDAEKRSVWMSMTDNEHLAIKAIMEEK
jgi:hypothetical protein